ncbi:MAG: ABC transporter ATP-binding protein [Candidatus Thiodiazotropha taylori]|nr:ABC transporter ATP-binding protein [Candidatus Thiodiazotropha taylori]MCG8081405.1 ABC transporter ATP-binding protein [Candidatus Thiodiazotropha taylori]MCG8107324.1 ABC transporter ATP-binding protein [Candidatus Thiodiazotropha taylori]MCG8109349.1 ABC transporter ATP-binding protein [Candidatus Thiodiazotropha taylori]MCW4279661.1 ABC transporter ATP-binding protein [Candidatus Thiodiazotropha taylori]
MSAEIQKNPKPLLSAHGLVKHFGSSRVVDGVDLQCRSGEILGMLGANGAGKTTTLRLCYGFLQPDEGSVFIDGIERERDPDGVNRLIGVCTQDDTFDTDFTVQDNLLWFGHYFRPRPTNLESRVRELLDRFDLSRYAKAKPDTLSGGYRRRLMIARALVHQPKVLFLDEPTTGLDPQARMAVWELVDGLRSEGLGIVLTTHYMDEAERLSDNLLVLKEGQVVSVGAPRTVLGDLVGEHVVVLDAKIPQATAVESWLEKEGLGEPTRILNTWQFALDGTGLARFSSAFGELRFEVRPPNLDDLFLQLTDDDS